MSFRGPAIVMATQVRLHADGFEVPPQWAAVDCGLALKAHPMTCYSASESSDRISSTWLAGCATTLTGCTAKASPGGVTWNRQRQSLAEAAAAAARRNGSRIYLRVRLACCPS